MPMCKVRVYVCTYVCMCLCVCVCINLIIAYTSSFEWERRILAAGSISAVRAFVRDVRFLSFSCTEYKSVAISRWCISEYIFELLIICFVNNITTSARSSEGASEPSRSNGGPDFYRKYMWKEARWVIRNIERQKKKWKRRFT